MKNAQLRNVYQGQSVILNGLGSGHGHKGRTVSVIHKFTEPGGKIILGLRELPITVDASEIERLTHVDVFTIDVYQPEATVNEVPIVKVRSLRVAMPETNDTGVYKGELSIAEDIIKGLDLYYSKEQVHAIAQWVAFLSTQE